MSYVMVDVESDGPIPGDYSMIAIGAVIVEPSLSKRFKAYLKPISQRWVSEALKVSGYSREETLEFPLPEIAMQKFFGWVQENAIAVPYFISDNNGYDWQFVNWYFHHFLGKNPFGFSSTNLGSFYKGVRKSVYENFKHLRETTHSHDPLDDAIGNAEALIKMKRMYDLKIRLR